MPEEIAEGWMPNALRFDVRTLARLAVWGGLAATALGLAVISAYSGNGSQRLATATPASPLSPPVQPAPPDAAPAAETAEAINRLTEELHELSGDQEQLVTRVTSLERGLDDVTGSIKRQAAAAATSAPTAPAINAAASPAASTQAAPTSAPPTPVPVAMSQPNSGSPAAQAPASVEVAEPLAADEANRIAEPSTATPPGLGIDVGGAINFEGLRTLWLSTKHSSPAVTDDMLPLVAVRENGRTRSVDLRLVIGPVANVEVAGRLCAALAAAHRYCQPVAYEGQRLLLTDAAARVGSVAARHSAIGP
jgi:hypothetical protein